jgi:hypothetical protein
MNEGRNGRFAELFQNALGDWPAEIKLEPLRYIDKFNGRYSVQGLFDISEEISAKYIGAADEILMRTLHHAIYIELHRLAPAVTSLLLRTLRQSAVESRFQLCLLEAIKTDGWTPRDVDLARRYLPGDDA